MSCLGLSFCGGQEWSQFRGGVLQGKLTTGRPVQELEEGSLRWTRQIPAGHSSPVISKGRVYVTSYSAEEKRVATHCFSLASGEPLWMASE
ncbi:MAG: PQQ-binding-like beta-propeller repeat protein [Planctomycetota bacterium]|nr:PQQ-binding-like beta-propeller repeat protein [Planctomycetota bacterium]